MIITARSIVGEASMTQHEYNRRNERKKYGVDIIFAYKGKIFRGIVKNLSLGGAFIATPNVNLFSKDDTITLNIPFTTGKKSLKKRGAIRWINNEGIAIEFF